MRAEGGDRGGQLCTTGPHPHGAALWQTEDKRIRYSHLLRRNLQPSIYRQTLGSVCLYGCHSHSSTPHDITSRAVAALWLLWLCCRKNHRMYLCMYVWECPRMHNKSRRDNSPRPRALRSHRSGEIEARSGSGVWKANKPVTTFFGSDYF